MNSITLAALIDYRMTRAVGAAAPGTEPPASADTTTYVVRVPDDLYEWLRATAFSAHVSMNSVVIAALRRYRAAPHADNAAPPSPGHPARP